LLRAATPQIMLKGVFEDVANDAENVFDAVEGDEEGWTTGGVWFLPMLNSRGKMGLGLVEDVKGCSRGCLVGDRRWHRIQGPRNQPLLRPLSISGHSFQPPIPICRQPSSLNTFQLIPKVPCCTAVITHEEYVNEGWKMGA